MSKLTILLALKDRHLETNKWIENNYYDEFNYIIADGSLGEENRSIFSKIKQKNFNYIRFKKDITLNDYYKKVYESSLLVKTPFVMQVDNDDIINKLGITECLNFINKYPDISIITGHISGFNKKKNRIYLTDFKENNCTHIKNQNNSFQIENYLNNYRIIWYSIYRTNIFQKAWQDCLLFSCKHVVNTELLHGLSSLANGIFDFKNNTTYIRNTGQTDSIFKSISSEEIKKSKNEIKEIILFISKKYNLDENKILSTYQSAERKYKKRNIFIRVILYIIRQKSVSFKQLISLINKINFLN